MVRSAQFFYFIPNFGSCGACSQKMSQIEIKLTIWWPKQNSMIEKVKPHRARILFWKLEKSFPKWFALPYFFKFYPQLWLKWSLPKKMSQIGLKLTIWWPRQSSVIEKVKPHPAPILFWKSVKTCPKWFAPPNFFLFYPQLWLKWSLPTKMSEIGLKFTIWWPKQSSVIKKN